MMRLIVFILISAMQIMLATDDPAKRGAATQVIPRIKEIRVEKIGALTGWTRDQAKAIDIIPPPVGEASILWNPSIKRWMYTYLNESTASIELREAENPGGPWSIPTVVTTARDYPQLYGAFMTASFMKDGGKTFYFVMSMYGPYNTFLMKATLVLE
jgi:hypothetical protein